MCMGGLINSLVTGWLGVGGGAPAQESRAAPGMAEAPAALRRLPPSGVTLVERPRAVSRAAEGRALPDDAALLARLLRLATLSDDPEALARAAVARFGSFAGVLAASPRDLYTITGLGKHSVAAIKLVQEAAQRLLRAGAASKPVLNRWPAVQAYLTSIMAREKIEQFRILFLDDAGRLLADEAQARGTVNHTPVYPREVARRALEMAASGVILVHNHPSGDPTPSGADIEMTEQVRAALGCFSIPVLDHVIIGNGRCFGFREAGLLEIE